MRVFISNCDFAMNYALLYSVLDAFADLAVDLQFRTLK
jgi:phosphoenolpyruvate carboxylase